jgi:uncharacterized membrane protein YeaQ/YmgE (transglycosylase-associated protein family)
MSIGIPCLDVFGAMYIMKITYQKEVLMGILSWIVVGLIGGWLAEQLIRGPKVGLIGATILGVVGGLLGGFLASTFLKIHDPITGINLPSILTSFLGAVLLLIVIRMTNGRRIRL